MGWLEREIWETSRKGRAEHLESLPDGLFEEHGMVRVAVLDALEVLVLAPEGIAGTLENL